MNEKNFFRIQAKEVIKAYQYLIENDERLDDRALCDLVDNLISENNLPFTNKPTNF